MSGKNWALAFALTAGFAAATVSVASSIAIAPAAPTPLDDVSINIVAPSCALWPAPERQGNTFLLIAFIAPGPCPTEYSTHIELGTLGPGTYQVIAKPPDWNAGAFPALTSSFDVSPAPISITTLPALPTSQDTPQLVLTSALSSVGNYATFTLPPSIRPGRIDVAAGVASLANPPPGPPVFVTRFRLGSLPAGAYAVNVSFGGLIIATGSMQVSVPAVALALLDDRFTAQLSRPGGANSVLASAVRLSDQSGYFWFFDSGNVEVTLKLVDGRALNGAFWVFVASMTDTPFTVTVTDHDSCPVVSCATRSYRTVANQNRNFIDTQAFPE